MNFVKKKYKMSKNERGRLCMKKIKYEEIIKDMPLGYAFHKIIINNDGKPVDVEYIEVNDAFKNILNLGEDNVIGKRITEILPNITNYEFDLIKFYGECAINGTDGECEEYFDDVGRWYKISIYSPEKYYLISFITDITRQINKREYITYHDGLTNAYNRNFFNEKLEMIDIEKNLPVSVIMGDVNGLKLANDAFGHLVGDKLLISAVDIMKRVCRNDDIIIRWGGDEFIILLLKTEAENVQKISDRIRKECSNEYVELINISISLGHCTKYTKEEDIMRVISKAEEMMYKVKMLESKSVKSNTLKLIKSTLQKKNDQYNLHSKRTGNICRLIGKAMGFSEEKVSELEILGDIHDIGKVGVDQSLLNKVEELTVEEWKEIKKHSQIGYQILSSSSDMAFLGEHVLAHHERYDGLGYPKGLKGDEIPLMARILALADAYEAMTNYRPYREQKTSNEAVIEIIKKSGSQFDPKIVEVFVTKVVNFIQEDDIKK